MKIRDLAAIVTVLALFSGCGGQVTCDKPERYQKARAGTRIDAPDDLDELQSAKEMTLPKASPRDPRPEGSRCLDLPPRVLIEKG